MVQWLKKLFGHNDEQPTDEDSPEIFDDASSFVWNQHMRIVLAIIVVFVSAIFMWWIVA